MNTSPCKCLHAWLPLFFNGLLRERAHSRAIFILFLICRRNRNRAFSRHRQKTGKYLHTFAAEMQLLFMEKICGINCDQIKIFVYAGPEIHATPTT